MAFKQNCKDWRGMRMLPVCCLLISMLFITSGVSCQAPEQVSPPSQAPSPSPSPSPSPTPTPLTPPAPETAEPPLVEEWKADGVITDGEYLGEMKYSDFEIYWLGDEQFIYIGMRAKTNGWVSMAVQPGSVMQDADMVFGFVSDGETSVYDLFSTGAYGPHPPDTELGGTDDILEFGGGEAEGFTTIEFKRELDTGDEYDKPLTRGVNKIIWAYGSSDELAGRHSGRGYGEINL